MTKQHIALAAITARVLGYYLTIEDNPAVVDTVVRVYSPSKVPVVKWFPYRPLDGTIQHGHCPWPVNDCLGHFLVRIHMETHFGIKTPHYWE